MKTIEEFTMGLIGAGLRLWVEDNDLRIRAPKGMLTGELVTQIRERKREIILFLRESLEEPSGDENLIEKVSRDQDLPLSFGQQRLWFVSQLHESNTSADAYNMPVALRLNGPLDPSVLEKSVGALFQRHEILRTCFPSKQGVPHQKIQPYKAKPLPLFDLTALPAADRDPLARQLVQKMAHFRFELATAPLVRFQLLRLERERHVLFINAHHIISDAWSKDIFAKELLDHYEALSLGMAPPFPDLPIQYADFAYWQRRQLAKEIPTQLAYWKRQLEDRAPFVNLPLDHPRSSLISDDWGRCDIEIPPELLERITDLTNRRDATLFMALLAAFDILLFRYGGQEDISVGVPIAGRRSLQVEPLIGFFINTLVLRADLSGNPSFYQILDRMREVALAAFANQDVPFEKLVEEMQPERSRILTPFFQVVFNFRETHVVGIHEHGGKLGKTPLFYSVLDENFDRAKFDLTLTITKQPQALASFFEYKAGLFEPTTIQGLAVHFEQILQRAVANPQLPVYQLSLLGEGERRKLLDQWSRPKTDQPVNQSLVQLFENQVERRPDATALCFQGRMLTYDALNKTANRTAGYLAAHGIGQDISIGLLMERSLEMVSGLLAILKAGGAYIPLDPANPAERLTFIAEDARIRLLLTSDAIALDWIPPETEILSLDPLAKEIGRFSEQNPARSVLPQTLAYVIYTSGSTGKPKGSMVTHANVGRLFRETQEWFQFGNSDIWTLFHSFAFDFSVWEIWGALLYGGRLVITPYLVSREPRSFLRLIENEKVTVLNQTPSAFGQLIQAEASLADQKFGTALRLVIFGGEALNMALLEPWLRSHGDVKPRLVNMYGITETTVHVTYRPLTSGDLGAHGGRIGGPIPDLGLYVLDCCMDLVPIMAVGELFVGGAGLSRGYLGRPELTAARFLPDPFTGKPGERLYRTGDLARRHDRGDIAYLGRADHQVKIRGFRIEPGEIEAALTEHRLIREALAVVRRNRSGEPSLVAYLTLYDGAGRPGDEESSTALRTSRLRSFLKKRLPDYMVPSAFVVMQNFPLTANGKINRRALPEPKSDGDRDHDELKTSTEKKLAVIWENILGATNVGGQSNFFDLGGHSLLATRVIARIRETLAVDLPLESLFTAPTIAELGKQIEERLAVRSDQDPFVIHPRPAEIDSPLSFAQERLWILNQMEESESSRIAYNIPLTLRFRGPLDVSALERAILTIIRRHELLRTAFTIVDGLPVQRVNSEICFVIGLVDLSRVNEREREGVAKRLMQEEMRRPFMLDAPPLLRTQLLSLSRAQHILVATMHHIVSDGWSIGILINELTILYNAFSKQETPSLAALEIQYADFAYWQRQWLNGSESHQRLAYWKNQLAGAPALHQIPTDYPRPPIQHFHGKSVAINLRGRDAKALKQFARETGATLFMVLEAAFALLTSRYSRQEDVLIGTPVANRNHGNLEGLIGFFVNTIVIRNDFSGSPTFKAILERVRRTTLAAFAHQDLPFERVVEALQPNRDLSYPPIFQIMFALQNTPREKLQLANLTIEPLETESISAQYDLTLGWNEVEAGLSGRLEYRTDLFSPETAQRLASHYQTLLRHIVLEPENPYPSILSSSELHEILVTWNDTAQDYPENSCLHEFFEGQVSKAPDIIAVVFGDAQFTYRELNRRANRLARTLRAHQITPEVPIAICMGRSIDLMICLVATLKAGCPYVPLDPSYPEKRLRFMLEDSGARVLLAPKALAERIATRNVTVLRPEKESGTDDEKNHDLKMSAGNAAYIIYTSGSTGKPKGVAVTHRSIVNTLIWRRQTYRIDRGSDPFKQHPFLLTPRFGSSSLRSWSARGSSYLYPRDMRVAPI